LQSAKRPKPLTFKEIAMSIKQEIESLAETLKTQRDELAVQMHLASMDVKNEWEHNEQRWEQFKAQLAEIGDETKDVTEELAAATIIIGEELGSAYRRIVDRLKSSS
jgi:hypothetical protein